MLARFAHVAGGLLREHGSRLQAQREAAISEERRKELVERTQELWRQHRMMKQTEHIAHVGGWEFDPVGATAEWSEEVYKIAGLALGETITLEKVLALFPPEHAGRLSVALEQTATGKGPFDIELQLAQRPDRWVNCPGFRGRPRLHCLQAFEGAVRSTGRAKCHILAALGTAR
tara:strand:+ start:5809 stop:6330 length:522 start_codon:yes stop_codon:yes gene_type:complete